MSGKKNSSLFTFQFKTKELVINEYPSLYFKEQETSSILSVPCKGKKIYAKLPVPSSRPSGPKAEVEKEVFLFVFPEILIFCPQDKDGTFILEKEDWKDQPK